MIYDKEIVILKLPDTSGTLLQGKLQDSTELNQLLSLLNWKKERQKRREQTL